MLESNLEKKKIRNAYIKAIACQLLPSLILAIAESAIVTDESKSIFEYLPLALGVIFALGIVLLFIYGYWLGITVAFKYAEYKGYPRYFGLVGLLNIFGLSFLYLLDNKNIATSSDPEAKPLANFSFSEIVFGLIAIFVFLIPCMVTAIAISENIGIGEALDYLDNEDTVTVLYLFLEIVFFWYFLKKLKAAKINLKSLTGSLQKIDFKLPLGLAVAQYFFAWGFNNITLYYLSFVVPNYVEGRVNQEHTVTYVGFFAFAISVVIFAPILEEILFRGILFQKLTINRGLKSGITISSIIFAVVHFRYDVLPLFITGIILIILYLKTKQLIVPIVCHFFYNFIAIAWMFHHQFLSGYDHSIPVTVVQYQEQLSDRFALRILFIALSAPYLIYFIDQNFPHNYDANKLPYLANQTEQL